MERIVYYKTASPYPNDFTKFCSLNGIEIDNNFLTLEGRDIKSIAVEGNYFIITLYNGKELKANFSSIYGGYQAGQGIDHDKFDNQKIIETNAELSETTHSITVRGARIGTYKEGDVINVGTSVQEILANMLDRVYDVVAVDPVSNIDITINGDNPIRKYYEVGDLLTNIRIKMVEDGDSRGYFIGEDGWEHTQIAGCNTEKVHYFRNGGQIYESTSTAEYTGYSFDNNNKLEEGEYTFGTKIDYSASTVQAVKSDGSHSNVSIPAGTSDEATASFKASYKYYYGYIPMHPWAKYYDVITSRQDLIDKNFQYGWCNQNGDTVIESLESNEDSSAIVLVLPEKYNKIKYTENTLNAPVNVDERWIEQKHEADDSNLRFTYINGSKSTRYYVYILHSLIPVKYNKITFGRS